MRAPARGGRFAAAAAPRRAAARRHRSRDARNASAHATALVNPTRMPARIKMHASHDMMRVTHICRRAPAARPPARRRRGPRRVVAMLVDGDVVFQPEMLCLAKGDNRNASQRYVALSLCKGRNLAVLET